MHQDFDPLNPQPGQAAYNALTLRLYDSYVLGLSNRYFWHCPTEVLQARYDSLVSSRHLEIGVGTGYFLDKLCTHSPFEMLYLLDLNPHSLKATSRRIQRFNPVGIQANALEPFPCLPASFDSVGINYLIHCLPGSPAQKGVVFDHISRVLTDTGVCFGSTIVNTRKMSLAGSLVMALYNRKGIFGNAQDTPEALRRELEARFVEVEIELIGAVLLFVARKPKR